MFGGTVIGGWSATHRAARQRSTPGWSPTTLALVISLALTALLGMVLAWGDWLQVTSQSLYFLRRTVNISAGALFFGAGVAQLCLGRVDHAGFRGDGGVLVALGLSTAFLSGQGPLLHHSELTQTLNPLAWALVAASTLAVLGATRADAAGEAMRSAVVLGCTLTATLVTFLGLVAARHLAGISLDPSPVAQTGLEVAIGVLWFVAALKVSESSRASGDAGTEAPVLAALGCVWLMRGGAVAAPAAWGLASAGLLALVAIVAFTMAMTELTETTESERGRMAAAESALAVASRALESAEHDRRDIRHGCRNSMLALRLATQTLAVHGERLDAEARLRLSEAVDAEVIELERLLTQQRRGGSPTPALVPAQAVRT